MELSVCMLVPVLLCLYTVLTDAVYVPTGHGAVCTYEGHTYQFGEVFYPDPCRRCECGQKGQNVCTIADCFMPPCVDAVRRPGECCHECPNGPNCRTRDGTVIQHGQTLALATGETCQCNTDRYARYSGTQTEAICSVKRNNLIPNILV